MLINLNTATAASDNKWQAFDFISVVIATRSTSTSESQQKAYTKLSVFLPEKYSSFLPSSKGNV